jgi:signal transduction histidine kinase
MLELGEVATAWPLGVSLAAAAAARGVSVGRRRAALNEALHELRRPLQALALVAPPRGPESPVGDSLQLAATALERLEREINGEPLAPLRSLVPVRPLLDSAASRWRVQAQLGGASLQLRPCGTDAVVVGDRRRLSQALDNLLANAVEHGGPEIEVEARTDGDTVLIAVADRGQARLRPGRRAPRRLAARLSGRRRHGHGLRVVRRVAAEHGASFELRRREGRTEAVLALPLPPGPRRLSRHVQTESRIGAEAR